MPISSSHLIYYRPRISSLIKVPTFWGINEFKKSKQSIQQLYCTCFHLGTLSHVPARRGLCFNASLTAGVFPVAYSTQPTCHVNTSLHNFTTNISQVTASVTTCQASTHCFCPDWILLKAKSLQSLILW